MTVLKRITWEFALKTRLGAWVCGGIEQNKKKELGHGLQCGDCGEEGSGGRGWERINGVGEKENKVSSLCPLSLRPHALGPIACTKSYHTSSIFEKKVT